MFEPRRILVPTDFTENADRALKVAIDIAKASKGQVYLLHVDRSVALFLGEAIVAQKAAVEAENTDERRARDKMIEEVRRVSKEAEVKVEIEERHGVTFDAILAYIKEKDVDLVVIEPHAWKGEMDRYLGGITGKLLQKGTFPMLVLPAMN